jgi:spermidine/putrescine transport system permease protein
MILPIYNTLDTMPENLVLASKDLGRSTVDTFLFVIIPYAKTAIFSGVTLVFLPSLTTVAVPQFLNNSPNGSMIGDIIIQEAVNASINAISLARVSVLSIVLSSTILIIFVIAIVFRKIMNKIKYSYKERHEK